MHWNFYMFIISTFLNFSKKVELVVKMKVGGVREVQILQ